MLSNYLTTGEASFNAYKSSISLSFAKEELKIDYLHEKYRGVRSLTLTHCALTSLKGIEQFEQLEELNVRSNSLQQVSELYRIASKELIVRLEFAGNDIEYFGEGLFINLVQVFPNLVELNGKNYHSIIHRNHSGSHQMKKIMARSYQIQKNMLATIRKTDRSTKKHKISHATSQQCPPAIQDESQRQNQQTSRNRQLQCTSKKKSCIQYSPQSQAEYKENLNNSNRLKEYDVSLGDISNIPMTKSIRGSYISNIGSSHLKNQKKKGLEIFTLNESLHGRQPLSQPTATFAMQKDRQAQENGGLMFKNRQKAKYDMQTVPIEECRYESKEEYQRPTKRQTYQSQPDELNQSSESSLAEDNLIREEKTCNQIGLWHLACELYVKNLNLKCFNAWKRIPCHSNFPVKRSFL